MLSNGSLEQTNPRVTDPHNRELVVSEQLLITRVYLTPLFHDNQHSVRTTQGTVPKLLSILMIGYSPRSSYSMYNKYVGYCRPKHALKANNGEKRRRFSQIPARSLLLSEEETGCPALSFLATLQPFPA